MGRTALPRLEGPIFLALDNVMSTDHASRVAGLVRAKLREVNCVQVIDIQDQDVITPPQRHGFECARPDTRFYLLIRPDYGSLPDRQHSGLRQRIEGVAGEIVDQELASVKPASKVVALTGTRLR